MDSKKLKKSNILIKHPEIDTKTKKVNYSIPCSDCTGHTGRKDGGPWHMLGRCRRVGSKTEC